MPSETAHWVLGLAHLGCCGYLIASTVEIRAPVRCRPQDAKKWKLEWLFPNGASSTDQSVAVTDVLLSIARTR